uniref:Uncharacterized protein n=1 Tax=Cannabis sativa TaxID=3483 RepID=A0A803NXB2_CANSA
MGAVDQIWVGTWKPCLWLYPSKGKGSRRWVLVMIGLRKCWASFLGVSSIVTSFSSEWLWILVAKRLWWDLSHLLLGVAVGVVLLGWETKTTLGFLWLYFFHFWDGVCEGPFQAPFSGELLDDEGVIGWTCDFHVWYTEVDFMVGKLKVRSGSLPSTMKVDKGLPATTSYKLNVDTGLSGVERIYGCCQ